MNETEHVTDLEASEEYISEDSTESDSPSVTEVEVNDSGGENVSYSTDVSETLETSITTVSTVDNIERIADNTSGILLVNTAIFFAVVIAFIAKIFGGYFSM